ncbi:energy-coupling factor transporter ATP-binding protein EcfA2 [Arthrobacter sp. SORGH_AS 212]|uniref:ATP-binding cassette domain-containing protein n=1 Tax=Pseudarthrobacter sp. SORGH_AS 212 TaxID=3041777 RepID=UPI00277EA2CC|nr:energy-coupling factor transporter ATP-binding protein EcfA2 [Arthrobacter sp. SORGH_AS_0212]
MPETPSVQPSMPLHAWQVPTPGGIANMTSSPGRTTVVLGANGAGKSGLATWMMREFPSDKNIERLAAHRQIWLSTSASSLTPATRLSNGSYWERQERQDESRWKDVLGDNRNSILLLDLSSAENYHNAKIAKAVESEADWKDLGERPFVKLNRILRRAGLDVSVSISEVGELSTKNSSDVEYQIAMMSDGEKSGLILAGEVLTAPKDAVILLDEPERHLHRSVSAPLVTSALRERPDCSFVVFTHDIELATELKTGGAAVFVLKGSVWNEGRIVEWDLQEVPSDVEIPDGVMQAILGARRRILFCEGIHGGLDDQLYTALYPDWHVVPVGSCGEVIRSTKNLKNIHGFAWVESKGIIDADRRTDAEVETFAKDGIWVNASHEVENLLFLPICQAAIAGKQAAARDVDVTQLLGKGHIESVEELKREDVKERIITQAVLADARSALSAQVNSLTQKSLTTNPIILTHALDRDAFSAQYESLVVQSDLEAFMLQFPIRESGYRNRVAKALFCTSVDDYIAMVMVQIRQDAALQQELRNRIERVTQATQDVVQTAT